MQYMKTRKFQGNQKKSYYDSQRTVAGQRVKITYQTEDGNIYGEVLHPDEKVMVVADQKQNTNPPRPGMVLKKVTNIFRGETYEWIHLILSTGEELTCTREHPFSVKDKGWVTAINLQTGDQFLTSDGKECSLAGKWIEKLDHPEMTYNFEVEGLHNYFVGEDGILVHNRCKLGRAMEKQGLLNATDDAHHLYPQQYRPEFKNIGIDVDDVANGFAMENSIHRGANAIKYNQLWETVDFANLSKEAARQHMIDFMEQVYKIKIK